MSFDNHDWPGCHAIIRDRHLKEFRRCANPKRDGHDYCGRHQPKTTWQRVRLAVHGMVGRVKGMLA